MPQNRLEHYKKIDTLVRRIKKNWNTDDIENLFTLYEGLLSNVIGKLLRRYNDLDIPHIVKSHFLELISEYRYTKNGVKVYFSRYMKRKLFRRVNNYMKEVYHVEKNKKRKKNTVLHMDDSELFESYKNVCHYLSVEYGELYLDLFLCKYVLGLTHKATRKVVHESNAQVMATLMRDLKVFVYRYLVV